MNFRPILFIALSLCSGISTAYFFMRNFIVWAILFLSLTILFIAIFLIFFSSKEKFRRNLIFVIILLLFFLVGTVGLNSQLTSFVNADLSGHYYKVAGRIKSIDKTESATKIILDNVYISGNVKGNTDYKVAVLVYGENELDIGDEIEFSNHLYDNSYIYEDNFNATDVERKIKYNTSLSISEITVTGKNLTIFDRVNLFIRDTLKAGLSEREFSVAYALLTGNDNSMDYDLVNAYRTAGVAHIFAVSGLHIGFLATALTFILSKFKIKGVFKACIIIPLLIFYSGVCSFSASSIRATVMTAVMLIASIFGERYDGLTSTSLSAIIILLFSPVQLLCVGFQLSFGVVIGINLLSKPIAKLFKFLPKKLSSAFGLVLSAQLFALPISVSVFGCFSIIGIIANLLFIPIVSAIYIATLLLTIIGGVFCISHIVLFPMNYVFMFVNMCISAFDHSALMVGGIVFGGAILSYYATMIICSGIINVKKMTKMISAVVLAVICVSTVSVYTISNANSTKLYVSGSNTLSATVIQTKQANALIVSDTNYVYSINRLQRIASRSGISKIQDLIFMNGYSLDMQVFITKMRTVFEINNVHYYGERNLSMENIIKKSFGDITFNCYKDGQNLNVKAFICTFALEGNVLMGNLNGKRMAIFSSFRKGEVGFYGFDQNFDVMICHNRASTLISRYKPSVGISYLALSGVLNAQTNGNLTLNLT